MYRTFLLHSQTICLSSFATATWHTIVQLKQFQIEKKIISIVYGYATRCIRNCNLPVPSQRLRVGLACRHFASSRIIVARQLVSYWRRLRICNGHGQSKTLCPPQSTSGTRSSQHQTWRCTQCYNFMVMGKMIQWEYWWWIGSYPHDACLYWW